MQDEQHVLALSTALGSSKISLALAYSVQAASVVLCCVALTQQGWMGFPYSLGLVVRLHAVFGLSGALAPGKPRRGYHDIAKFVIDTLSRVCVCDFRVSF